MSAVKTLVVLLALALLGSQAAPAGPSCEALNRTVSQNDLHRVNGHWVLVWALSHGPNSDEMLTNLISSHLELTLSEDNTTVIYHEKNLHGDVCTTYFANLTVTSEDDVYKISLNRSVLDKGGVVYLLNDTEVMSVLESCEDCLTLLFKAKGNSILMIHRREGHHRDPEQVKKFHSDYEKLAECLSLPDGLRFTYDGAADFCHKKSSPEKNSD